MTPDAAPDAAADVARRLAELVSAACDGEVSADEAVAAPSLALLGVSSLATLRLIDAVEDEFGIPLVLDDDARFLDSVPALAAYLADHGLGSDGAAA